MPYILNDWPPEPPGQNKNWSKAKLSILKLLWSLDWVTGAEIFNAVQQTYYDRRIRELRESGWQIETSKDGRKYRLLSHKKNQGIIRQYPTALQRRLIQENCEGCKICGSTINLQYDHKIPLEKQGTSETNNLQLLCSNCNVIKRGMCKRCLLENCDDCPYAFPEKFEGRTIVFLDEQTNIRLVEVARNSGISSSELLRQIITNYLNR